jgi:hypothetical protein
LNCPVPKARGGRGETKWGASRASPTSTSVADEVPAVAKATPAFLNIF